MKATDLMRWMFFLRAFVPSWVFFVEVTPEIRLDARTVVNDEKRPWRNVLPPIRRSWKNLFWNPQNNFLHAAHNSLHHLLTDINELPNTSQENVESLASYKIVKNLVEFKLSAEKVCSGSFYQFRISIHPSIATQELPQDFLFSPLYKFPNAHPDESSHDHG